MKHFKYIITFFLLLSIMKGSAQSWVQINSSLGQNQMPVIETITSNSEKFVFKVKIPGFYRTSIVQAGVTYHSLEFEENQTLRGIGEPALPVITQQIGLPSKGDIHGI